MAIHSSILAWRIPMDRETWWVILHGVAKSLTETKHSTVCKYILILQIQRPQSCSQKLLTLYQLQSLSIDNSWQWILGWSLGWSQSTWNSSPLASCFFFFFFFSKQGSMGSWTTKFYLDVLIKHEIIHRRNGHGKSMLKSIKEKYSLIIKSFEWRTLFFEHCLKENCHYFMLRFLPNLAFLSDWCIFL